MPPWTLVTLLSLSWSQVLAGGGSGLLLGLAKDGKLGDGGANDWDILIICMAGQSRLLPLICLNLTTISSLRGLTEPCGRRLDCCDWSY